MTPVIPAALDPDALAHAHQTLPSLVRILDAFNHRHRNQHHSSHWWATFGIFRRSVRSLAINVDRIQAQRKRDATTVTMLSQARRMRAHVVPRSYVAFSQLTADNQHATLGLLLLTVLAKVNTALDNLLPPSNRDRSDSLPVASPSRLVKPEQPDSSTSTLLGDGHKGIDDLGRGVAVLRETQLSARASGAADLVAIDETRVLGPGINASVSKDAKEKKKKRKKLKKEGDELRSLFGSLV